MTAQPFPANERTFLVSERMVPTFGNQRGPYVVTSSKSNRGLEKRIAQARNPENHQKPLYAVRVKLKDGVRFEPYEPFCRLEDVLNSVWVEERKRLREEEERARLARERKFQEEREEAAREAERQRKAKIGEAFLKLQSGEPIDPAELGDAIIKALEEAQKSNQREVFGGFHGQFLPPMPYFRMPPRFPGR